MKKNYMTPELLLTQLISNDIITNSQYEKVAFTSMALGDGDADGLDFAF